MKRIEKAQKMMTQHELVEAKPSEIAKVYVDNLDTLPEYSLEVDSENKYMMPQQQKDFIKYYMQFKSIPGAADLAKIDLDVAKEYFTSYSTQQEIRRLSKALYHRQFASRLLSIDEIGGYLSSLITDENVPLGDRLKTMEKVQVAKMIIDLNNMKNGTLNDPSIIMNVNIEQELKSLSVTTIKQLLMNSEKIAKEANYDKEELIDRLDIDKTYSPEEIAYLKTLTTEELLMLIDESNKERKYRK